MMYRCPPDSQHRRLSVGSYPSLLPLQRFELFNCQCWGKDNPAAEDCQEKFINDEYCRGKFCSIRRLFVQVNFLAEHLHCVRRHQVRTENTCRTACCCYLMLTHTFLHRFRRKQAFLPKRFRKDLRLLRNPKSFSFLPNFLRKIIKTLRKRIQAVDPVTQTANNKPSQPFAKFLRKTPKIRPYRVFK